MTTIAWHSRRSDGSDFNTEEDLMVLSGTAAAEVEVVEDEVDPRPLAPTVKVISHGIGTGGGTVSDDIRQSYNAMGFNLLDSGTLDLAEPRSEEAPFKARPDLRFVDPRHCYIYGTNIVETARAAMGEAAYREHIGSIVIGDRSLRGLGAQGEPALARLAAIARSDEIERWATWPLLPFAPQPQNATGLQRWQGAEKVQTRVTDITCGGDSGSVGNAILLDVVARKRRFADAIGLNLEQFIVLTGGMLYGRGTEAQVHDRIAGNEDEFLAKLDEAMIERRVSVGLETVQFSTPLVDFGRVFVFNGDIYDAVTKTIPESSRRVYMAEAGLTIAVAMASGAVSRVEEVENNAAFKRGYVRTLRLVGHGLNRAALAEELASRRSARLRRVLLERIAGGVAA